MGGRGAARLGSAGRAGAAGPGRAVRPAATGGHDSPPAPPRSGRAAAALAGASPVRLGHASFGAVRCCPPAPGSARCVSAIPECFFPADVPAAPLLLRGEAELGPGGRSRTRVPADIRTLPTGGLPAAGALTLASFGSSGKRMNNAWFL